MNRYKLSIWYFQVYGEFRSWHWAIIECHPRFDELDETIHSGIAETGDDAFHNAFAVGGINWSDTIKPYSP